MSKEPALLLHQLLESQVFITYTTTRSYVRLTFTNKTIRSFLKDQIADVVGLLYLSESTSEYRHTNLRNLKVIHDMLEAKAAIPKLKKS